MRAYVLTTGVIFGLLVVAHVLRLAQEPRMLSDPWWRLITAAAAVLCFWAFCVLSLARRGGGTAA